MKHFIYMIALIFIGFLGFISSGINNPAKAASQDECAIWLCLPAGFPAGCGAAYQAFAKRVFRTRPKPPLPKMSACTDDGKNPDGFRFTAKIKKKVRIPKRVIDIRNFRVSFGGGSLGLLPSQRRPCEVDSISKEVDDLRNGVRKGAVIGCREHKVDSVMNKLKAHGKTFIGKKDKDGDKILDRSYRVDKEKIYLEKETVIRKYISELTTAYKDGICDRESKEECLGHYLETEVFEKNNSYGKYIFDDKKYRPLPLGTLRSIVGQSNYN